MKAILEFDLPEDHEQFNAATQAQDWVLAMDELDQYLRGLCKHGSTYRSAEGALNVTCEMLHAILQEHNLSLDVIS